MSDRAIRANQQGTNQGGDVSGTTAPDGKHSLNNYITGGTGTLLAGVTYDYMSVSYNSDSPTNTEDTYTYKINGSGGTAVATVVITYTDTNKTDISAVLRTLP